MLGQAVQRVQRGAQAVRQVQRADEVQLARAGGRQQVQANVGGRCAVRHHRVRQTLHVVGRQVLVFGADVAFIEPPGVARQVVHVVA